MMSVLTTVLVGILMGYIGKRWILGDDRGGLITAELLGISGAMVAGLVGWMMGWFPGGSVTSLLASAFGAILAIDIYRWAEMAGHHR